MNEHRVRMARDLKKAAITKDAPIWRRLSDEALKPTIARRTINVNKLSRLTRSGDTVAFAGKVLGTGSMSHAITIFSFGVSESAAAKIRKAGGRIINHTAMVSEKPSGTGVVLLG